MKQLRSLTLVGVEAVGIFWDVWCDKPWRRPESIAQRQPIRRSVKWLVIYECCDRATTYVFRPFAGIGLRAKHYDSSQAKVLWIARVLGVASTLVKYEIRDVLVCDLSEETARLDHQIRNLRLLSGSSHISLGMVLVKSLTVAPRVNGYGVFSGLQKTQLYSGRQ